jgi:regulator of sigma E protease
LVRRERSGFAKESEVKVNGVIILTILVFILILGLLIFVHESGHFLLARLTNIKVEEFAFGFPPRLWSCKKGATRYSVNALPIGGYVRLLGEEKTSQDPCSYSRKPPLIRLAVAVAGVSMNFVLAWLLISLGFMVGMTPLVSSAQDLGGVEEPMVLVAQVSKGSAAEKAGLKPGVQLLDFESAEAVQKYTRQRQGEKVKIAVKDLREKKTDRLSVELGQGEAPLGVVLLETGIVKLGFFRALGQGAKETWLTFVIIWKSLGQFFARLFTDAKIQEEVVGPVGLFVITGQAVKLGLAFVIQLTALISLNLGIVNILPFPALDGGRSIFILSEIVIGRKLIREQVENIIHMIGFFMLIGLILLITYRDIINFAL